MTHSLITYCDVDYAIDRENKKSRSGYVMFLNNGLVSWGSCKQTCIVGSTTEAKYIASFVALEKVIWMCCLLFYLGHPQLNPTPLLSDNQSCIHLA
jgi:hypothetical protein